MSKKAVKIEIVEEGEQRILLQFFADGTEKRVPIDGTPKKPRIPARPYWYWALATGRRKFF